MILDCTHGQADLGLRLSKRHKSNMTWDGMDGGAAGVG